MIMMVSVRLTYVFTPKKHEDLILIKYQTPLKRKYNLFSLKETRVFFVLELIIALKFS